MSRQINSSDLISQKCLNISCKKKKTKIDDYVRVALEMFKKKEEIKEEDVFEEERDDKWFVTDVNHSSSEKVERPHAAGRD